MLLLPGFSDAKEITMSNTWCWRDTQPFKWPGRYSPPPPPLTLHNPGFLTATLLNMFNNTGRSQKITFFWLLQHPRLKKTVKPVFILPRLLFYVFWKHVKVPPIYLSSPRRPKRIWRTGFLLTQSWLSPGSIRWSISLEYSCPPFPRF